VVGGQLLYISRRRKMCVVAGFKNFENSLTTVKVVTKTKVAPFYLGHGVCTAFCCICVELHLFLHLLYIVYNFIINI